MEPRTLYHTVLSYLSFVLLMGFIVCASLVQRLRNFLVDRFGQFFGGNFANVAQASGVPAALGFFVFSTMFLSLVARHFNLLFWFQKWVRSSIISSANITALSVVLALTHHRSLLSSPSSNPSSPDPSTQSYELLILLTFAAAMFLRFSSVDHSHDPELSVSNRLRSRAMEFFMYTSFLPTFPMVWRWQFMVPLTLLVCTSRSNEVFRIWQNSKPQIRDLHDHVIVRRRFQKFYELAAERYETDLPGIQWPGTQNPNYKGYPSDPQGHPQVEDRLKKLKEEVKKAGLYGYDWEPNNQYGFLWADGSGLLMSSTITIIVSIIASSLRGAPNVWSVLLSAISVGIFLYLFLQCVPGFIVFVASIDNPDPNDPELRVWFRQVTTFIKVLAFEGLPLDLHQRHPPWYMVVIHGVEGLELISYVAVYALFRMIGLGLLFLMLSLVRITKLGLALHRVWSKLVPALAFCIANITALDVMRAKSAILQAEIALDTRIQPCPTTSPCIHARCTELKDGASLLEDLDKALCGQQNSAGFSSTASVIDDKDVRRQAISAGLYESIMKNMARDTGFPADIASRLHPMLALLYRIHLHERRCEHMHVRAVTEMLENYGRNSSSRTSSTCLKEQEVKIMKVQLQACMLLYHFNEPSVVIPSITGRTLNEWLHTRRTNVSSVKFCDFKPT